MLNCKPGSEMDAFWDRLSLKSQLLAETLGGGGGGGGGGECRVTISEKRHT